MLAMGQKLRPSSWAIIAYHMFPPKPSAVSRTSYILQEYLWQVIRRFSRVKLGMFFYRHQFPGAPSLPPPPAAHSSTGSSHGSGVPNGSSKDQIKLHTSVPVQCDRWFETGPRPGLCYNRHFVEVYTREQEVLPLSQKGEFSCTNQDEIVDSCHYRLSTLIVSAPISKTY